MAADLSFYRVPVFGGSILAAVSCNLASSFLLGQSKFHAGDKA